MARNLTLHIVASVPLSNLNRDDTGTPKRVNIGGAIRALHSSQSLKRGERMQYEEASSDLSVRSGNLVAKVVEEAKRLVPDANEADLKKRATKLLGELTKAAPKDGNKNGDDTTPADASAGDESDRSIWLSLEEINTAATAVAQQSDDTFIEAGKTGSLAIAAFGRMFANAPDKSTEAAIAVSPAVSTHGAAFETDYFSTVDDFNKAEHGQGATFLGVSQYVNGVFYRTVTIDREQLKRSWTGFDSKEAPEQLKELITALVYGQPRGKKNSTAPFTLAAVVLAEEQRHRIAYDFETPVSTDKDSGGYLLPTIRRLNDQYVRARSFDPDNFGDVQVVAGTAEIDGLFAQARHGSLAELRDAVVSWILK